METQNALEPQNVLRDDYDKDHIALACKNNGRKRSVLSVQHCMNCDIDTYG